jgi:hypothetical protein
MNQEQIHARHLVELGQLEAIFTEMGYAAQLVEKSPQIPYHTLLVGLEPDEKGRPLQMALTFYPLGEDDLESTLLLQYFIELPFDLDEKGLARAVELLPHINNKAVVGHFGVTDGQNKLHYRYVQALPLYETVSQDAVVDIVVLASYTPVLFGDVLEDLAEGKISLEQARAKVDAKYAQP